MTKVPIDRRVLDLYDDYCHGRIERRDFFARAGALTIGGVSALALAESLLPRYAEAQTISFTDERIKARYVDYPSPGGSRRDEMRGYLVRPSGDGPFPGRAGDPREPRPKPLYRGRGAARGGRGISWRWRPDGLAPIGGYPGNDDDGRAMQKTLDQAKLRQDMVEQRPLLSRSHPISRAASWA